ncbi:globin [Engelhardtia mirabilis]|uniref:Group 2 truncated hemoglobin GlbO n=1 Tax=Engelhardtia mirabilis TaxID=2528011 RepID=A0A518BR94_9BACT|nr:Group 2 truncated hemoglobin GlbO [Planctomycetes bacterium Pla133]QDV03807.1 Group 2 truncated hemoglobin GlbO [Planctomycetes bacterium Pla86]
MPTDPYAGLEQLYDELGEEGFSALVSSFYRRVRGDDLLAPMYPDDDWDGSQGRLLDFIVGRCGGPPRYVEARGHPRLRMRHARFRLDQAARDRWMEHMGAALGELDTDAHTRARLHAFFDATATFLLNS